jgi:hypothetical protein
MTGRTALVLAATVVALVWGAAVPPAFAQGDAAQVEVGIDRPGDDLNCIFPVADAVTCQQTCQGNPDCAAFTWVRAGHFPQAPFNGNPICCLKRGVPAPTANECCISGVK